MVEQNAPDNMEAIFFSSYGKAMLSLTDSNYFKRQQKFEVLNHSMSVISDYYETTTEDKEKVLRKIAAYINKMYNVTFVYQRQSIDLVGALSAAAGVTGSKQWCISLINSTKNTFINELKEISQKHDDAFIADILSEFEANNEAQNKEQFSLKSINKSLDDLKSINKSIDKKLSRSLGFGLLGFFFVIYAWIYSRNSNLAPIISLIAIIAFIPGIIFGNNEKKKTGKSTGLIVSIIGEVCAVMTAFIILIMNNI